MSWILLTTFFNQVTYTLVNAQAKIVHNGDLTDFKRPRFNVLLNLPILSTVYNQDQLHNTVTLAEYLADFNKFLLRE